MYCSTHQMPLYPGTGARSERGEHDTIINAPLRPGDGGEQFRAAFDSVILPRLRDFRPDLVVAGELIEHTPDTPGWLARIGEVRPGIRLLATTPNATSVINLVLAFIGRENTHQDHLQIYSYKTLATLARRIALRDVLITPYYYHSHLMRGRAPRPLLPLIYAADYLALMPIQYLFPLTAGGLILEGVLGRP
jgi:hypothetical protein